MASQTQGEEFVEAVRTAEDAAATAFRARTLEREPRTAVVIDLVEKAYRCGHAQGVLDAIDAMNAIAGED